MPTVEDLQPEQVRREASQLSRSIFDSWHKLNAILISHEQVIHRRWVSKTASKRKQTLLKVWPGMSACHRPDFEALLKEPEEQRIRDTQFKDAYMFPSINLEDLSKVRPLLIMLNARGRNHPQAFAMADHQPTVFAFVNHAVYPGHLEDHYITYPEHSTADTYGQLKKEDHFWPPELRFQYTQRDLCPGQGLQVLRIQKKLLEFSVNVCREILHDVDCDAVHPPRPEPPLPTSNHPLTLTDEKIEDAYRLPAKINLESLDVLITAKVEACEDHFIALREDPSYFAETMMAHKEHRPELLSDEKGRQDPSQRSTHNLAFWEKVFDEVIFHAHVEFEHWKNIQERLRDVRQLHAKHADNLVPSKRLPEELLFAFVRFEDHLDRLCRLITQALEEHFSPSAPLRKWFFRDSDLEKHFKKWAFVAKKEFATCPIRERLYELLTRVGDQEDSDAKCGLELHVDQLEHFLQNRPGARDLLTALFQEWVSSIGIIAQAKRQINLFQPWAGSFEFAGQERGRDIHRLGSARMQGLKDITHLKRGPSVTQKAIPLSKFAYPSNKRRTQETVEAMRRAEENLDTLWRAVDRGLVPIVERNSQLAGLSKFLGTAGSLTLERTPPWTPSVHAVDKAVKEANGLAGLSLTEYYHDLEKRTSTTVEEDTTSPRGAKTKTQGITTLPDPEHASPVRPATPPPTYHVSTKSLKVFRTLFFTPNESSQPGEIAWTDFVEALQSVGFRAQKLQGSSWQFRSDQKSILFHQPHPSSKLAFWTARFFGRRLRKRFGWHAGLFALKRDAGAGAGIEGNG